tara:strand:- start:4846 stop:8700 length:3855 start_codon:yes stop_codon:yes gene_type:complete
MNGENHGFSLFGVKSLPKKSRKKRDRIANAGKATFILIALTCAIILFTMVSRIYSEAYVPSEETEVSGIGANKPLSETVKSWNVETWNEDWSVDDPRRERTNVTLRAEWTEVKYEAYNQNEILGITFDRYEDIQRYLCDEGIMADSFAPYESWKPKHLLPGQDREPASYNPISDQFFDIFLRDTPPTAGIGDFWIDSSDGNIAHIWKGLRWEELGPQSSMLSEISQRHPYDEESRDPIWSDQKLRVYYSPIEPLFRSSGDIWIVTDESGDRIDFRTYNYTLWKENRYTSGWGWENGSLEELPSILPLPEELNEEIHPEFCSRAEVAVFIQRNGLTGSYEIYHISHDDGYSFRVKPGSTKVIHNDLEIVLSNHCEGSFHSSGIREDFSIPEGDFWYNISSFPPNYGGLGHVGEGDYWVDSDSSSSKAYRFENGSWKPDYTISPVIYPCERMTLMIRGDGEFSYGNMTQWNKYGARQDSSFFYDQEPNEIQTITLHPAQIGQSGLGSLWLEHTMNYTVTFTQLEGPPSDARDGSYKEVDDFILGPMGDWLNSRIFNDGDQDNDGIYDVCDDDIDGDNSKNPIMGGNKGDPESLERALSQCPQAVPMVLEDGQINEEWMIDTNSDGVHDDTEDDDIDGDGVKNLVDGQGHNLASLTDSARWGWPEEGMTSSEAIEFYQSLAPSSSDKGLESLIGIWEDARDSEERMCDESYKNKFPSLAKDDCRRSTEFNANPPMDADDWCEGAMTLLQPRVWSSYCGISTSLETGIDEYQDPFPLEEIFAYAVLIAAFLLMIFPGVVVLPASNFLRRFDGDMTEPNPTWSRIVYLSELLGRLVSLSMRSILLIVGAYILSQTLASPIAIRIFVFTIGISLTLMSGLAVLTSISSIIKLRPEDGVRPSEGAVEGTFLLLTLITWLVVADWVIDRGILSGSICILLALSATKRMAAGASQLTRSQNINSDRVKRVVMGRDGWIIVASVFLIVGFFTIPFEVVNSFIFSNFPSQQPYRAGLRAAFWGSVYVVGYTMIFAIPVSIGGAIWLEEYAPRGKLQSGIQTLITNLAGVPAVVFGLFGLALCSSDRGFGMGLGGTILTAGVTMATMAMPTIVIASQEALRAVPPSLREGAFGIGCTKWQVVKDHVLPHSMPGMMTGTILAMSRIMGEAAPLILVGAVTSVFQEPDPLYYVDYTWLPTIDGFFQWVPGLESRVSEMPMWADRPIMTADPTSFTTWGSNPGGKYTVLPVQVYTWTDQPEEGFKVAAAGASLVLLGTLVMVNSVAILVRAHFRRFSQA